MTQANSEDLDAIIIGAGVGGVYAVYKLRQLGLRARALEKGSDVGGTWYWNRYPGAQCDTASFVYMPLLEETGYMPSEKYAHAPEILEHCQRIGKHFGLYDNAMFHTEVKDLAWDESAVRWTVVTRNFRVRPTPADVFAAIDALAAAR